MRLQKYGKCNLWKVRFAKTDPEWKQTTQYAHIQSHSESSKRKMPTGNSPRSDMERNGGGDPTPVNVSWPVILSSRISGLSHSTTGSDKSLPEPWASWSSSNLLLQTSVSEHSQRFQCLKKCLRRNFNLPDVISFLSTRWWTVKLFARSRKLFCAIFFSTRET